MKLQFFSQDLAKFICIMTIQGHSIPALARHLFHMEANFTELFFSHFLASFKAL